MATTYSDYNAHRLEQQMSFKGKYLFPIHGNMREKDDESNFTWGKLTLKQLHASVATIYNRP